ncbi:MAG: MarR family winged helix-turn-helix transcriptional regulator [Ornithinimicrobium sp.]|uniref:MarR family winged helix-turn-helix transcriptional regulator n=1 Tax=Ornithinimicrobium sp. TaxID=1977084 RepID=UPI0017C0854D|nr:MarR family transcriptional regulator [Actinomycetota bacterium]
MNTSQRAFGAGGHTGRHPVRSVTFALRVLVARTQQYADRVGHDRGLHRSDLTAMDHISQATVLGETLGPGDVARRMSLSPAAVTALVDRLESVGHLVRHRDEQDRRRIRLDLTDQATHTAIEMFRPMTRALADALEPYSDEELALILRALQDMTAALEQVDVGGPTLTPHETD